MAACKTCGGSSATRPQGQIEVPCKCGSNVAVSITSIDTRRGAMVVHDTLDPNQDWKKVDTLNADTIKWVRCPYTTYVPPAVWCPTCQANLVPQWKELCVSGTSAEVEAAQQNYHPTVIHYRQMARDLIKQYGSLKRVEYLSHFPEFEINFVFETRTVYSGQRRGEYDIHFLSLGYVGEGPRYARHFLDEAGFRMSSDEIDAIRPGAIIELRDGTVVVSYPEEATSTEAETPSEVTLEDDITLHKAIIQEDPDKVRALIARGDDIQVVDNDGATPLHYAAYVAHAEIAKILIQNGAYVDAKNAKGQTPLHEVAGHLHRERDEATMGVLVDAGASLSAQDNDGATPLHAAAIGGHFEAARFLLDRGADIEARAQQLTPLHFSAYAGKPEVTQLLIDCGADVFAEKDGMNPLYMAQQPSHSTTAGKQAVVQMLEKAMSQGRKTQPACTAKHSETPSPADSGRTATVTKGGARKGQRKWWQFWR